MCFISNEMLIVFQLRIQQVPSKRDGGADESAIDRYNDTNIDRTPNLNKNESPWLLGKVRIRFININNFG